MPAGDGTGPGGAGPMTGRAMGRCAGYAEGGYATAPGRGGRIGFFGRRGGGGRGFRNRYYETGLPNWNRYPAYREPVFERDASDTESLRRQVEFVAETLERIALRVEQLLKSRKGTE
ncbi:MAG: DUF5320 family protein [Candidatus Fermentibacteraceae bacterium]|nr:DUF5320 family protein [Candidatus Fermentibacteraceae bacterium]MBN2608621.1 DUF5320 family protein [Candidatus Fermentibacteraceae bacterium]